MTEAEKTRFDHLTVEQKVEYVDHLWSRIAGEAEPRPEDEEFDRLRRDEQIEHVQDLWDRIPEEERNRLELTEAQRRELERRLAEFDAHPERSVPWAEVRRELLGEP